MPERRAGRAPVIAVAVALLVTLVLVGGRATSARWSDSVTVPGTRLHSGLLDLRIDGQDDIADLGALDLGNLVPGTSTAGVVTVENAGDADLSYRVTSGGAGAAPLLAALSMTVTTASAVTSAATGPVCGGSAVTGSRTLAAGGAERLCVEVALPADAPASAAGRSAALDLTVDATAGGWTDSATVEGIDLSTVDLTAPELACTATGLGFVTVGWTAVPGATAYRLHSGMLGDVLTTLSAGVLSRTFMGVSGEVSVEAVFGSDTWVSPPSPSRTYAAVTGLGTCS
jgi:hypothetical protein